MPGTRELTVTGDLSVRMVEGIDRFLDRATRESIERRAQFWKRDFSSAEAYSRSVEPNRERLRRIIGAVDARVADPEMEVLSVDRGPTAIREPDEWTVQRVRWRVFPDVHGEGILFQPKGKVVARMIAIPDSDELARELINRDPTLGSWSPDPTDWAAAGVQVLIPVLLGESDTWSGNPRVAMTDQSHREWVYRQSFEIGRHVIGYEVQKIQAALDWFERQEGDLPVAVTGYRRGGPIALYAAALDRRIGFTVVHGYFGPREGLYSEPVDRNLFGLLREFGDAEIASLISPRELMVFSEAEYLTPVSKPQSQGRKRTRAPGEWRPPIGAGVRREVERARALISEKGRSIGSILHLGSGAGEARTADARALAALSGFLAVAPVARSARKLEAAPKHDFDDYRGARAGRQVKELVDHTQRLVRDYGWTRGAFRNDAGKMSPGQWAEAMSARKKFVWDELFGRIVEKPLALNPRTRLIEETDKWRRYEVMIDVWEDVYAWGELLLPKDLKPGERRPVVVCQHGLEGLPEHVIERDESTRAWRSYKAYGARLADRGFVVYAPHNPYRGGTKFRQLQRKANPLGLTLYSFILGQHQQTLNWLKAQPFVDPERIAFYGLSYGGTSAMRLPPLLDDYCLSICSACFNDWTRKITSLDFRSSYMFVHEYEQFSFGLGDKYNHAELAALIAPRPFMVERGHRDGVAPDEWVAHEYAKVRRLYVDLGIPERTEIEWFDGPHTINGQGTFDFLHKHLRWPKK